MYCLLFFLVVRHPEPVCGGGRVRNLINKQVNNKVYVNVRWPLFWWHTYGGELVLYLSKYLLLGPNKRYYVDTAGYQQHTDDALAQTSGLTGQGNTHWGKDCLLRDTTTQWVSWRYPLPKRQPLSLTIKEEQPLWGSPLNTHVSKVVGQEVVIKHVECCCQIKKQYFVRTCVI